MINEREKNDEIRNEIRTALQSITRARLHFLVFHLKKELKETS